MYSKDLLNTFFDGANEGKYHITRRCKSSMNNVFYKLTIKQDKIRGFFLTRVESR